MFDGIDAGSLNSGAARAAAVVPAAAQWAVLCCGCLAPLLPAACCVLAHQLPSQHACRSPFTPLAPLPPNPPLPALDRAIAAYRERPEWWAELRGRIMADAMRFSWNITAGSYVSLYGQVIQL